MHRQEHRCILSLEHADTRARSSLATDRSTCDLNRRWAIPTWLKKEVLWHWCPRTLAHKPQQCRTMMPVCSAPDQLLKGNKAVFSAFGSTNKQRANAVSKQTNRGPTSRAELPAAERPLLSPSPLAGTSRALRVRREGLRGRRSAPWRRRRSSSGLRQRDLALARAARRCCRYPPPGSAAAPALGPSPAPPAAARLPGPSHPRWRRASRSMIGSCRRSRARTRPASGPPWGEGRRGLRRRRRVRFLPSRSVGPGPGAARLTAPPQRRRGAVRSASGGSGSLGPGGRAAPAGAPPRPGRRLPAGRPTKKGRGWLRLRAGSADSGAERRCGRAPAPGHCVRGSGALPGFRRGRGAGAGAGAASRDVVPGLDAGVGCEAGWAPGTPRERPSPVCAGLHWKLVWNLVSGGGLCKAGWCTVDTMIIQREWKQSSEIHRRVHIPHPGHLTAFRAFLECRALSGCSVFNLMYWQMV